MKTVSDIRSSFLGYFEKEGHEVVQSSPLVPQNDPTLMFVNSGMVQFKNVFTGAETRPYKTATTAQKCVRAGGKHNDLDNVGYTARHHTFFEMLGNFSFGDYFKEQAIHHAWNVVTKSFGLPEEKLLVTVYSEDEEAAALWKKIAGLSDDRIIRISTSDNFWMMGDTGPCGPCSEIFYDHGEDIPGGPPGSPDEDGDRFIEIWNLVFMQYEQEPDGEGGYKRKALPKPSIDTGMGLERMAAIMQGVHSNYEIDLLDGIIQHSADLTGVSASGDQSASHRVIADHLRASSFLLADGVMPSNEGRGYVLRRIMRRGMRHAHLLGAQDPLMYKLFPTLVNLMGEAYPELRRAEPMIIDTLKTEEARFKKTLDHGLKLLEEEKSKLSSGQKLSGEAAFKLYDTYGFPIDLTQDALRNEQIDVDMAGFEACMEKQREQARANWSGAGGAATEKVWFELLQKCGATEFLGYAAENAEAQVVALVRDGESVDSLKEGEEGVVLTNQTPFYGESGGQVGDTGVIRALESDAELTVTDTQKAVGALHAHYVTCNKGELKVSDGVEMIVDHERRSAIRANHSATHLLHAALRNHLGEHVSQKGSLVNEKRLRFDISHPKALSAEELQAIEDEVNAEIWANTDVTTRLMAQEEAIEAGAMALFGEKYDDEVRVLTMGTVNDNQKPYSVELCGGTHVSRTGDIGLLKIVGDSALSAGVRRVEALTRKGALAYLADEDAKLNGVAALLKTATGDVQGRVQSLMEERKALEKQVADLRKQLATGGGSAGGAGDDVRDVAGVKFNAKVLDGFPPRDLKPMADELKGKIGSGVVALIATNEGKASIVVGVTDDLTDKINAVELVRAGAEALGGKGGGGRPDMAQAGGPDNGSANDAVVAIEKLLAS
jgi:alanyl-tRNA synthetase